MNPVCQDDNIIGTKCYSISGYEIDKPEAGITIIKSILNNGAFRSKKILEK